MRIWDQALLGGRNRETRRIKGKRKEKEKRKEKKRSKSLLIANEDTEMRAMLMRKEFEPLSR